MSVQLLQTSRNPVLQAGNDTAALQILVDKLKDFKAAENYCIRQSEAKATAVERQQLFEILLVLYLERSEYAFSHLNLNKMQLYFASHL